MGGLWSRVCGDEDATKPQSGDDQGSLWSRVCGDEDATKPQGGDDQNDETQGDHQSRSLSKKKKWGTNVVEPLHCKTDDELFPALGGGGSSSGTNNQPKNSNAGAHHNIINNKPTPAAAAAAAAASGLQPSTKPFPHLKTRNEVNHHVYDGDTLSLSGPAQERVRLIGIDAPELKAAEDFAKESGELLRKLVPNKAPVVLEYSEKNGADKYGRIVARVFVVSGNNAEMVCANDMMLLNGLASFYDPSNGADMDPALRLHMLALQTDAMRRKVGIWSNFDDVDVVKTSRGAAFHLRECEHVANIKNVKHIPKSEALGLGLSACRTCKP